MGSISTVVLWRVFILFKAAQFSTQQSANTGQLTLEPGETLHINTSEPSAAVADNWGNRRDLLLLAESNHSFINQIGDSREWKYGVARLVFAKDIILNSNSSVNISGENALSVESLEGNIVVKTMIDLSCTATELGGKCVGGYMPIDKVWYSAIIPGNGPGGTSKQYLQYWSNQCIGGSGHGGNGGKPAIQDIQVKGYSGLDYGKEDTHVLLGGSSGSYLEKSGYNITKPGHGGGAIQFVARKGSIVIEARIKANAQQTLGKYEIYSGSSGGLIRLEANEVQIKNGGSLEVNGAHAGKTGHTQAGWTEGSAGGAGGIVHILASAVFLSSGSISLKPGNSTNCANVDKASPGFLSIRDHSGHHGMFWNNDTVFPIIPEGFSWPSASSKTVLLPSGKYSTFIVALTQPSLTPAKTGSSTFPIASFLTTKELTIAATALYTSYVADLTSNQVRQVATDINYYPTATKFPTDLTVVTSASHVDTASEWDELLKNVTFLKNALRIPHNNSWTEDIQKLAQRFQTLVEKETLTEESVERFLKILNEFSIIINITPGKHQETMKSVAASLMTTAELSFERKNEDKWKTTSKLPTVLGIVENITLALGKTITQNQQFKFEHYSERTVVQVVTFKNNGDSKTMTHFMLPDITRTNLTVWKDTRDAVLIPLDGQRTFKDEFTVSIIIHRNISNILPTGFTERMEEQDNDFKVASHIISCSILYNPRLVANLMSLVELHFHYSDKRRSRSLCVFWDPRVSAWSTDGVRTLQINQTHTSCHSTHLTSFAVLTQFKELNISEDNELALGIVTYIGCGLSIACLFVTLLVYLAFETLSSERHKIHMSLAFALLLAQSLFLSGIKATRYKILCRVIAVGLHYLFSAAFTWMCIEGFHLYVMIVSVFSADSVRMKYYYLIGWGVPVVIVGVAASVHPTGYGTNKVCWLSTEDHFIWVFLGPVVSIIVINLIVLAAVMKVVTDSASATLTKTDYGHVKAGMKSVAVLLPLLGVSWAFGLLAINKKTIAFQYIFAISNSFQGVFIFLAHCVGSNDVRSAFKRMRQRQQLSRGSDNVSSVAAAHASVNLARPTDNDTKQHNTEDKSSKKLQGKMRFSLRSVPNTKVVKVKATKDRFEAAHLQIRRTYQMPHKESPRIKDCYEMSFLNCPQDVISQTHSANRKRSSKPM